MRASHVTVAVCNPADPEHRWEGLFVIDTRAMDCIVPASKLVAAGIEPMGKRKYELPDGSEASVDIGLAVVEFMAERTAATMIFGGEDVEPTLGLIPLASVGIEVDPRNQQLKRLPAVRLKSLLRK